MRVALVEGYMTCFVEQLWKEKKTAEKGTRKKSMAELNISGILPAYGGNVSKYSFIIF